MLRAELVNPFLEGAITFFTGAVSRDFRGADHGLKNAGQLHKK